MFLVDGVLASVDFKYILTIVKLFLDQKKYFKKSNITTYQDSNPSLAAQIYELFQTIFESRKFKA